MTAEVVPILTKIEGGRTKEAMRVREWFNEKGEALKNTHEHLSGFLIIAWDDEGFAASSLIMGTRFPLMPSVLKSEVSEIVSRHCSTPTNDDVDEEA